MVTVKFMGFILNTPGAQTPTLLSSSHTPPSRNRVNPLVLLIRGEFLATPLALGYPQTWESLAWIQNGYDQPSHPPGSLGWGHTEAQPLWLSNAGTEQTGRFGRAEDAVV